mgnify:CR=1 FL=1
MCTLRDNIQSKVLNSAPKSVSILHAAKAILLGSYLYNISDPMSI